MRKMPRILFPVASGGYAAVCSIFFCDQEGAYNMSLG